MKEIIIDGIDISECDNLYEKDDMICVDNGIEESCQGNNCYYKQLKRLEQENAELKAENERLRDNIKSISQPVLLPDVPIEVTNKYKQTLQEIKAIVCSNYEIIDPQGRKDILKLITKAEEE